jgi:hypothetical protein
LRSWGPHRALPLAASVPRHLSVLGCLHMQSFALSALECAEMLEALEAGREKSFFHDPNKGSR